MAYLSYYFYIIFSLIIFPFTIFNLLIEKTPLLPGTKSFVITSGSMEPVIPRGSIIYTLQKTNYAIGDIITFERNSKFISHRITDLVAVGRNIYYSTQGDANKVHDEDLVPLSKIDGRITAVIPVIGNIVLFYKTPVGLLTGTVLPMILLMGIFRKRRIAF